MKNGEFNFHVNDIFDNFLIETLHQRKNNAHNALRDPKAFEKTKNDKFM